MPYWRQAPRRRGSRYRAQSRRRAAPVRHAAPPNSPRQARLQPRHQEFRRPELVAPRAPDCIIGRGAAYRRRLGATRAGLPAAPAWPPPPRSADRTPVPTQALHPLPRHRSRPVRPGANALSARTAAGCQPHRHTFGRRRRSPPYTFGPLLDRRRHRTPSGPSEYARLCKAGHRPDRRVSRRMLLPIHR